jgi:hypothetical protein
MGFILNIIMISSTGVIGVVSNQYFDRPACVSGATVITDSLKAGMDASNKPGTYSTKKISSFTWTCTPLSLPEQPSK